MRTTVFQMIAFAGDKVQQTTRNMFLYYISRVFVWFKISVLRINAVGRFRLASVITKRSKQLNVLLYFVFNDVLLYNFNYQCFKKKVHVVSVVSAAMIFLFKMKTNVSRTLHFC